MKCPSEVELNEYAEQRLQGRRRQEIQAHLSQCNGCRADIAGLQWVSDRLSLLAEAEELPASHPRDDELAALAEGRLEGARRAAVLSHVGSCPECACVLGSLPRKARRAPLALALPRGWYTYAAAAAMIVVVIGFTLFTGRGGQRDLQSPFPPAAVSGSREGAAPAPSMAGQIAQAPGGEASVPPSVPRASTGLGASAVDEPKAAPHSDMSTAGARSGGGQARHERAVRAASSHGRRPRGDSLDGVEVAASAPGAPSFAALENATVSTLAAEAAKAVPAPAPAPPAISTDEPDRAALAPRPHGPSAEAAARLGGGLPGELRSTRGRAVPAASPVPESWLKAQYNTALQRQPLAGETASAAHKARVEAARRRWRPLAAPAAGKGNVLQAGLPEPAGTGKALLKRAAAGRSGHLPSRAPAAARQVSGSAQAKGLSGVAAGPPPPPPASSFAGVPPGTGHA